MRFHLFHLLAIGRQASPSVHVFVSISEWCMFPTFFLSANSKITVNACSPGLVRGTDHLRHSPIMRALFARAITYPWMWLFMRSPYQGAQTMVRLATDPELSKTSGEFFKWVWSGIRIGFQLNDTFCCFMSLAIASKPMFSNWSRMICWWRNCTKRAWKRWSWSDGFLLFY